MKYIWDDEREEAKAKQAKRFCWECEQPLLADIARHIEDPYAFSLCRKCVSIGEADMMDWPWPAEGSGQ